MTMYSKWGIFSVQNGQILIVLLAKPLNWSASSKRRRPTVMDPWLYTMSKHCGFQFVLFLCKAILSSHLEWSHWNKAQSLPLPAVLFFCASCTHKRKTLLLSHSECFHFSSIIMILQISAEWVGHLWRESVRVLFCVTERSKSIETRHLTPLQMLNVGCKYWNVVTRPRGLQYLLRRGKYSGKIQLNLSPEDFPAVIAQSYEVVCRPSSENCQHRKNSSPNCGISFSYGNLILCFVCYFAKARRGDSRHFLCFDNTHASTGKWELSGCLPRSKDDKFDEAWSLYRHCK